VGAIDLHVDALDVGPAEEARLAALIGAGEWARALRFRFARDRRRFIVRRGRLRERLAAHLGARPEALAFREGPFGKPELVDYDLPFSLSHSQEQMLLAIGDAALGCDIEWIDPDLDWRPLAESLFAAEEIEALALVSGAAARRGFFACWARKEAFVKAIGQGFSYPLDAFAVSVGPQAELRRGGEGWRLLALDAVAGHAGALVVPDGAEPVIVIRDHTTEQALAA
jgi:4'-phosphopantetheinyl transferase